MLSLAIVESPFQAMMVSEFMSHNQKCEFKIRFRDLYPHNLRQLKGSYFNNLKLVFIKKNFIYEMLFFLDLLKRRNKINFLIIPFYNSKFYWICRFILKPKETVFIDDGTHTIEYLKKRPYFLSNHNNSIFSIFAEDFDKKKYRKINIKKNSLVYLKDRLYQQNNTCQKSDHKIFIGNSLNPDYISDNEYLMMIKYTINEEKDWIYIPHRTEKETFLINLKKTIPYLNIIQVNKPIEIFLLEKNIKPKSVVGLISTCFFTLKILFPYCKMKLLFSENFNSSDLKFVRIKSFYQHAKKNGFNIK